MLVVDLRELARGPVETRDVLPAGDALFEGLDVVLAEPVVVAGRLQGTGEGRFFWQGSLRTVVADAVAVDLRPAVREELILAVPRFVECRADCRGLCPRCGKDLNAGPCGCPPATDLRWAALASLKDKLRYRGSIHPLTFLRWSNI